MTSPRMDTLLISTVGFGQPSPFIKQLPVVGLYSVAVGFALMVPSIAITSMPALIASALLMVGTTALASLSTRLRWSPTSAVLVPALDFVVVGVLRYATGESRSVFFAMVILPVLWVASLEGRRHIAYAFAGVTLSLLIPFALGARIDDNPNEVVRTLFSALSYGLAAAIINDLARLARRYVADVRAREELTRVELEQASAVQRALLPKPVPGADDYDFAGVCVPSRQIGGDFFDWYEVAGGTAFTVGDVMGKGVGAGIVAATVRAVVRSARNHDDLSVPLDRASDCLASDLGDAGVFATLFHARLDTETGRVRYIDAGHGLNLHVRADGSWDRLRSVNLPAGIVSSESWVTSTLTLAPGDMLVSCSDGILDLFDGTEESLGRVAGLAAGAPDARALVSRISSAADRRAVRDDDVTVLAVKRAAR